MYQSFISIIKQDLSTSILLDIFLEMTTSSKVIILKLALISTKSADTESTYIKYANVGNISSAQVVCGKGEFVRGACAKSIYIRGASAIEQLGMNSQFSQILRV